MKKLLVYLKDYRKESVLGPLFKLLEAFFELLSPLVIAGIIDIGIAGGDRSYILSRCLLLAALGVIGMICAITAQYFAAKAAVGFTARIRHSLFAHIQKLSYTELDSLGASTLMTRMTSDMNQVQTGMNLALRLLLRSPFVVFGSWIMAFTIDGKAALVFTVTVPVLAVVVVVIMAVTIPLYRKTQSSLDRVMGLMRENLSGVRVIRAFAREAGETAEFESRINHLAETQLHVGRIAALMNPLTYVVVNLGVIALVWTGALRVEAGIITQGAVVALYNYMAQILVELIKLANLIMNIAKAIACGNRVATVLEVRPGIEGSGSEKTPRPDAPTVEFRHVALRYKGSGADALTDIHFTAERGETIGIIGGTGSGKSSLVNLIPRFYDATGGAVLVDGVDVREYPTGQLRGMIGVVPQKAVLFQGSIRDNLRWGKKDADDAQLLAALETAQAAELVAGKPDGLDHRLEQGGRNLSGGQRQRLTIARALVRRPRILILDDSASALDYATDAALRRAIRGLEGGPTVFLVSQRASSILHADKIIVLDNGAIAGIGVHSDLLKSCGIYREIYETQFRKEDGREG